MQYSIIVIVMFTSWGWKARGNICHIPGRMPGTTGHSTNVSSLLDQSPIFVSQPLVTSPPSTIPYTTTSVLHPDKTQLTYSLASHWFPYFLLDKVQVPKYTSKSSINFLQPHLPSHSAHPPVSCGLSFCNNELLVACTQTCAGLPTYILLHLPRKTNAESILTLQTLF